VVLTVGLGAQAAITELVVEEGEELEDILHLLGSLPIQKMDKEGEGKESKTFQQGSVGLPPGDIANLAETHNGQRKLEKKLDATILAQESRDEREDLPVISLPSKSDDLIQPFQLSGELYIWSVILVWR
jgi:hypothetical protein